MAHRTNRRGLPVPTDAIAKRPALRSLTYLSLARATDVALTRAEEAVRTAVLVWSDIDSGLESDLDELASQLLDARKRTVEHVREVYGDRLRESAL